MSLMTKAELDFDATSIHADNELLNENLTQDTNDSRTHQTIARNWEGVESRNTF